MWKYAWSFVASFNVAIVVVSPSLLGILATILCLAVATYEWVIWWRNNGN